MPTRRSLFIVLLVILAGFAFSVSVLIKAIAACVECAAEIPCVGWAFSWLPPKYRLPLRLFVEEAIM